MFRLGLGAEQIAARLERPRGAIYRALEPVMTQGWADYREVVGLGEKDLSRIEQVLEELGAAAPPEVLYQRLGQRYDPAILRCVRAAWLQRRPPADP